MEESILISIKQLLGPGEEHDAFDPDIIININTALMELNQIGVGPSEGFRIEGSDETWDDFIPDLTQNGVMLDSIKSYIYIKVKLLFDPPINSSHIKSFENTLARLEWRLNVAADIPSE